MLSFGAVIFQSRPVFFLFSLGGSGSIKLRIKAPSRFSRLPFLSCEEMNARSKAIAFHLWHKNIVGKYNCLDVKILTKKCTGGPHLVRPHLVWSSLQCGYYKFYKNLNSAESSVMIIVIVRFHNPKIHLVRNPQVVLFTTYDPHLVRIHLVRKIF